MSAMNVVALAFNDRLRSMEWATITSKCQHARANKEENTSPYTPNDNHYSDNDLPERDNSRAHTTGRPPNTTISTSVTKLTLFAGPGAGV